MWREEIRQLQSGETGVSIHIQVFLLTLEHVIQYEFASVNVLISRQHPMQYLINTLVLVWGLASLFSTMPANMLCFLPWQPTFYVCSSCQPHFSFAHHVSLNWFFVHHVSLLLFLLTMSTSIMSAPFYFWPPCHPHFFSKFTMPASFCF